MMLPIALHVRDDNDILYVTRKEGQRRLVSIVDCRDSTIQTLKEYKKEGKERQIASANNRKNLDTPR